MLKIEAIGFDFRFNRFENIGSHEIELPIYSQNGETTDPQTLIFELKNKHQDSIVVSLSILYITKNGSYTFLLNSEDLNPVGVVAAYNL